MNLDYDIFIFDLYGTLIDIRSDEVCQETWVKWCDWLDAHEIRHPESVEFCDLFWKMDREYRIKEKEKGLHANPEIDVIEIYEKIFKDCGNESLSSEQLKEASYAFRVASREYMRLFPGVIEFLEEIRKRGKKAYILSNAQASYTEPEIQEMGLDLLVEDYLMSSDYYCMKPDKDFFDILISKYQLDVKRCVMLGDNAGSDMQGAQNAGMAGIHLAGKNGPQKFYLKKRKWIGRKNFPKIW